MSFNPQVEITELPDISTLVYQKLEDSYLNVLILRRIISSLIMVAGVTAFYFIQPFKWHPIWYKLPFFLVMLYVLWSFIKTIKGFQYKAYALREKDIVYKSGWLWRYTITTPFNRVQHVQIDQGPIERKFNLSRLKVFTAGGGTGDLMIPGIRPETANELKEFIVKKTQHGEEE